ncbi:MAG: hypothetical protein LAP85_03710 [Acidobacteriia bacterium]|nr:hypothetical protein [Terriglobia bacterium]
MINCRNCINWVDESLEQIEADPGATSHIFMGCRIYGFRENTVLENCPYYTESENLFTICNTCHITVPKVCVSLGECVNCTDTDLFCVDHCIGGDQRKYCTHFVRLYTEGAHLIDQDQAFDLFPILGMPGEKKDKVRTLDAAESASCETTPGADEGPEDPHV